MDEPRERDEGAPPSDASVPSGTVEERERAGLQVGLLWVGVFVVTALLVALVAWLAS